MEAAGASEIADSPVLDENRLRVLRDVEGDDGRPFIFEFFELFQSDAAQRIEELRQVVRTGVLTGVRKMAHTLKGSCRNVGAVAMAEACRQLEAIGDTGTAAEAAVIVERIADECVRVEDAIALLLSAADSGSVGA